MLSGMTSNPRARFEVAHPRGARDFFDALVAVGLLDRDSKGRYANASESDCYLVRGKPSYIGGLLRHLERFWTPCQLHVRIA